LLRYFDMGNFQLNQFYVKFATKCIFPPKTCYIFEKMDELRNAYREALFSGSLNKKASLAGLFSMSLFTDKDNAEKKYKIIFV